jgi:arylsulfatase A-like enzyme
VVTYVWGLEFQSVYAEDFEPLLDRLADASSILLSLLFWTLLICALVALVGTLWRQSILLQINQPIVRIYCILASGFYLGRWINRWASPHLETPVIYWAVILAVSLAYFLVRQRRRRAPAATASDLPSWQDCFYFGVIPVVFASILVLGIKIGTSLTLPKAVIASPAGKSPPSDQSRAQLPNVIVIVFDSLRAQSLSLYGNPAVSIPSLERIAAGSSVYVENHANSTTTGPSMTTLLTGKHPFSHGRLSREIAPRVDENNLLRILRSHGYSTAAVTSNLEAALSSLAVNAELTFPESYAFSFHPFSWLRDFGVFPTLLGGRMYQDLSLLFPFLGFPLRTSSYGHIEDTLSRAKDIVARLPAPFLLIVHIYEPHESYILPSFFEFIDGITKRLTAPSSIVAFYARYDNGQQPIVDSYRAEYEASVRGVDSELGKFFDFLESRFDRDSTLLMITADHGESFERGYFGHGEELYENSTRVPLIIRYPGQKSGERVAGLTQSIDIAPTILRALTIPIPDWMDGQPLMLGVSPKNRATVTINFQHPDENIFYQLPTKLAIWRNQYKLVASCESGSQELYDLKNDPQELFNIARQQAALVEKLTCPNF